MIQNINPHHIYCQSPDVVSREIEGTVVIIPIIADIGDLENELFSLNETGKIIWQNLDGKKTMKEIATKLCNEFEADEEEIEQDIIGLLEELLKRRMIVEKLKS